MLSMHNPWKGYCNFKGILVLLLSFLFALILLEFGLAFYHKNQQKKAAYYDWSYYTNTGVRIQRQGELKLELHPQLLFRNLPNQKTSRFTINRFGFRGKEADLTRGRPIILMGASVAFGSGLPSDEGTLSSHLDSLLGLPTINAGVIGYGSTQELVSIVVQLAEFNPKLIIILDGLISFGQVFTSGTSDNFLETQNFDLVNGELDAAAYLRDGSLWLKTKHTFEVFFPNTIAAMDTSATRLHAQLKPNYKKLEKIRETYLNNIKKIYNFGIGQGYRILVVSEFLNVSQDRAEMAQAYFTFCKDIGSGLSKLNIAHINMCDALSNGILLREDFLDERHLTSTGYHKVAKYLLPTIQKLLK